VNTLHRPTTPYIFLKRVRNADIFLAVIQLVHLIFFTNSLAGDFLCWALIHTISFLTLTVLRYSARNSNRYVYIPWKPLVFLLIVAFSFKFYSRLPYMMSWYNEGLLLTRSNPELGSGGWTSYGSIFFYPLAILLAFTTLPRRYYQIFIFLVFVICGIDFIALGTRNAPMFVLIFHMLLIPHRITTRKLPLILFFIVIFVSIFNYSTINRTQESGEGNFDWLTVFEFTGSTQILTINDEVVRPISKSAPEMMPVIFLMHYLTHPVAEFRNLMNISNLDSGGLYYLKDQFCAIGFCNRDDSLYQIELKNPRAGVYQTFWGSFVLDFGVPGALALYSLSVIAIYFLQRQSPQSLGLVIILFSQIFLLSSIENYLYNGLGLVQCLSIFIIYYLLTVRFKISSNNPVTLK
jgi:hypothetical protein